VQGVTLRPARAGDEGTIAEIWELGWRDAHLGNVPDQLLAVRTSESFRTRAADRLGDTTVGLVDGQVAGFVMIVADEVEQMYVAARHRGHGVADLLMEDAERQIAAAGHGVAWLAVVAGNARARRFYERRGWSDDGLFEHHAPSERGPVLVPAHRYVKRVR
jgi:GNAT superfamily N-acetyltransferase